jgi:hypothetical protein
MLLQGFSQPRGEVAGDPGCPYDERVRTWVIAIAVLIALAILGMSLHVISLRALAVFAAAFGVLVVTTRVLGQKLR